MKKNDWNIVNDELNEVNTNIEFNKKKNRVVSCDLETANEIAKKIQYLGCYALNQALSVNEKIAYFNSYLKSRMDFLADIATGTPVMESSKLFYGELIAGIDKNRILLDRISGIDDFKYKIKLHDCRRCNKSEGNCFLSDCRNDISSINDFNVAIPNDIIGQHAFYIIIENIIRNTAKHSAKENGDLVTFHVEVREPSTTQSGRCPKLNSYYEIHVYDNIHFEKEAKDFNDDKQFFKDNGIFNINGEDIDNIATIDVLEKLVYRQNVYVNQSLLDNEKKLRQGAWGMIEMEAAAAYLRKIPVERIDNKEYDLNIDDLKGKEYGVSENDYKTANILKAFIKETKENKRHLAYRFFMLKPKEILLIADHAVFDKIKQIGSDQIDLTKLSSALINYGIWITSKETTPEGKIDVFNEKSIYEHEILLNLAKEPVKINTGVLPDRIINSCSDSLLKALIEIDNGNKATAFKEAVWEDYTKTDLKSIFVFPFKKSTVSYSFGDRIAQNFSARYSHHGADWDNLVSRFPDTYSYLDITMGLGNMVDTLCKSAIKEGGKDKQQDKVVFTKLLDSIHCQVIVLDERIQEAAYLFKYQPEATNKCAYPAKIPFYQIYNTSGIYVPAKDEHGFNFSAISYPSTARENVKDLLENVKSVFLDSSRNMNFNRVKFLVMHLGVLEKILSAGKERNSDPLKEKEIIKKLVCELLDALPYSRGGKVKPVIISGRGLPPNLPNDISFVNYSAISQYLIDNRNKNLLNELLFSTRKIAKP